MTVLMPQGSGPLFVGRISELGRYVRKYIYRVPGLCQASGSALRFAEGCKHAVRSAVSITSVVYMFLRGACVPNTFGGSCCCQNSREQKEQYDLLWMAFMLG